MLRNGLPHIVYYADTEILPGTELTIDVGDRLFDEQVLALYPLRIVLYRRVIG